MPRFAFVIHPLNPKQASKRYPVARLLPDRVIESLMRKMKPQVVSEITGIRSMVGTELTGLFIGVPLTPHMMTGGVPIEHTYATIVRAAEMAKQEGAEIIGLGAFTSVAGDGGITVAKRSPIPVTTGNSYTVATAVEGTLKAAEMLGIDTAASCLAVVGATGSIGKTCALAMASRFARTLVVGRDEVRTADVARTIENACATTDLDDILQADVVVTVTSAGGAIVEPKHLKPGSIVCDVSRPRDVSAKVVEERPDVLVIEGGVVKVPGAVDFGFDFGFPPGTAYACMCETMMLALEGRLESYTIGKDVALEQVVETKNWAEKHGFELAGFRSFEREVTEETIQRVRDARAVAPA